MEEKNKEIEELTTRPHTDWEAKMIGEAELEEAFFGTIATIIVVPLIPAMIGYRVIKRAINKRKRKRP